MIMFAYQLFVGLVGTSGLEPPTSRLSGARSNHLSYAPLWLSSRFPSCTSGGDDGNRTHDPLLAGQVLSQLSYTPIGLGIIFFSLSDIGHSKLNNKQISVFLCLHSTHSRRPSSLVFVLPICKYEISVSDISHSP